MNTEVKKFTLAELTTMVQELQVRIVALEAAATSKNNTSQREMTDDDARRILNGDLAQTKHKEAGEKLGLSYGQIYSCRLGFTFKAIHKELNAIAGYKNPWMK
jgi:hypothetical protein